MKLKQNERGIQAAILAMSVVQMGTNAISPILADIAAAFPQAGASSIQFLMTFPSLMVLFFSLLAAMAASRVPKKYLAAAGCGLFAVSGVLSWLFHGSLPLLFLWAAMMGIGIGLVVPMATSLVTDFFTGPAGQKMMGLQSTAANAGAMLMTFLGGLLAGIHWSCTYLVYLIAVPGLVLSLLSLPQRPSRAAEGQAGGSMLPLLKKPVILRSCLLALLVTMLFNTAPTNLSMLLEENGLGTAAQAGTATTLLLFSGAVGGLCFARLAKLFGRRVVVFGFAMLAAGQLICAFASSLAVVFLGCLVCGCAISTVMPQVMLEASAQSGGNTAGTSALAMASSNLGGFCAPLLTILAQALTGSASTAPRLAVSAACAALTAVVLLATLRGKD